MGVSRESAAPETRGDDVIERLGASFIGANPAPQPLGAREVDGARRQAAEAAERCVISLAKRSKR
jgi:hypothetical protein